MIPSNIEIGILKFLDNTATPKQLQELEEWLEDAVNKELFNDYVLMHYAINTGFHNMADRSLKDELIHKIKKGKSESKKQLTISKRFLTTLLKYAAVLLFFTVAIYLLFDNSVNPKQNPSVGGGQITLQLDNGKVEVIGENDLRKILDTEGSEVGFQNGNQLNYNKGYGPEKLIYNELKIPNGKNFNLVLSDGTKVSLNSGSSIKFPVQFLPGQNREVTLTGEAYFEVKKDSVDPFIVHVADLKVRVLGTEFNLSSYPEDKQVTTVLVQGSVGLYRDDGYEPATTTFMEPGFMGVYDHSSGNIGLDEVDTDMYTGWRSGKLVFRGVQFKNIVTKLERIYNVSIVNNNKELGEQYFSASFDKDDPMEQIFDSFRTSYRFTYTIKNEKITIN